MALTSACVVRQALSITASLKENQGRSQSAPPVRLTEWGQPVPVWGRGGEAGVASLDSETMISQMNKKLHKASAHEPSKTNLEPP